MAKETNKILGHGADADGIEEYDNPLPDWWLGLFFFTIVWAVGYTAYFHFIADDSQEKRYNREMAAAAEMWPESSGPVVLATDAATLGEGEGVYLQTCASCHDAAMTGGIGPSLIDSEWIHGGDGESIVNTISEGVAAKGMPAWGPILGPKKVQAVAAFILSKQGSAPAVAPDPGAEVADGGSDDTDGGSADTDGGTADDADAAASGTVADADLGKQVWDANCAACHKPDMTGLVGPSLVDDEWIHGGELDQIKATITNGVPEKGMVAWGPMLSEEKIDAVARFVHEAANKTQP